MKSSNNDNLIINPSNNDDDDDDSRIPEDAINAPVGPLPSVSSRINFAEEEVSKNLKYDLWIVGTGTLGILLLIIIIHCYYYYHCY